MSDILIKGMEMPKEGTQRVMFITIDSTGLVELLDLDTHTLIEAYHAFPVPPHGRCIDADALGIRDAEKQAYEALQKEKGEFFTEETLIEYLRGRCDGLIHASGLVRFAPTIIPAEESE